VRVKQDCVRDCTIHKYFIKVSLKWAEQTRTSKSFAINKIVEASTKSLVNDYFVYYWTSVAELTVAIYVRSSIN